MLINTYQFRESTFDQVNIVLRPNIFKAYDDYFFIRSPNITNFVNFDDETVANINKRGTSINLLFEMNLRLSNKITIKTRKVFNIFDLMGALGGITELLI